MLIKSLLYSCSHKRPSICIHISCHAPLIICHFYFTFTAASPIEENMINLSNTFFLNFNPCVQCISLCLSAEQCVILLNHTLSSQSHILTFDLPGPPLFLLVCIRHRSSIPAVTFPSFCRFITPYLNFSPRPLSSSHPSPCVSLRSSERTDSQPDH